MDSNKFKGSFAIDSSVEANELRMFADPKIDRQIKKEDTLKNTEEFERIKKFNYFTHNKFYNYNIVDSHIGVSKDIF